MGLTTAERNRRKRERKKREREEQRKREEEEKEQEEEKNEEIEIEYVAEAVVPDEFEALRRFQERASAIITDDENNQLSNEALQSEEHLDQTDEDGHPLSKRRLKEKIRPSVAELKQRVQRPDLVEAHDITATDPGFLIQLKAVAGTVPVPRHWGRKRKYLQGKVSHQKICLRAPCFTNTNLTVSYSLFALTGRMI